MIKHSLPIHRWIYVIPGFLQTRGGDNGMVALWKSLHMLYSDYSTRVELAHWNSDWRAHAECINRMCDDQPGKIVIAGYSWGGYSSTVLARELAKHGRKVEQMILCDAVYRHNYWLGNWRALCPMRKIKVPANVKEVRWFKQRKNYPRGHRLTPESDTTKINKPTELMQPHQKCDESYLFHREVFRKCHPVLGRTSTTC